MRQTILDLEESKIREVANAGMGRKDVLAFWFGESDEVTPDFIRQAAIDSLQSGETFYSHNLGLPELREAVADYTGALHGPVAANRIAITSGGVNALMLAVQALVNAGDRVVAVTPVWPNLTAQPLILGADLHCVPLQPVNGAWTLDMDALLAAVTSDTQLLIINAPNNPTGWTLTQAEQARIQTAVPHVHHGATARRFAVQAIDPSAMRQHVGQQAQFPQHLQAGRLQQETRADRTRFRRTFEDLHPVPVAREQQRGGLAGGAVSDDGDVQRFHSGDFSVAPAQGSGMQALKNPAGAGFK